MKAFVSALETLRPPDKTPPVAQSPAVQIYTDGACQPNPGKAGFAAILVQPDKTELVLSGGRRLSTNNRAELLAMLLGLETLAAMLPPETRVELYSDSGYCINGMNKRWAESWEQQGWNVRGDPVPNADLWQRMLVAVRARKCKFTWVRGHAGNPYNERCDVLAKAAALSATEPDDAYERRN